MCVKSLTASLWLVHTGRQHHAEGEDRDIGQARLNIGQTVRGSSGWLVEKVEEGSCCLL